MFSSFQLGKDSTSAFENTGHSTDAIAELNKRFIGDIIWDKPQKPLKDSSMGFYPYALILLFFLGVIYYQVYIYNQDDENPLNTHDI